MKFTMIGAALAALLLAAPARAAGDVEPVDVDAYLRRDSFGTVRISPGGEYYAATVPLEDRTILAVIRRSDKQVTARIGGEKDSVVQDFWWANDSRVVVATARRFGAEDRPYLDGKLYAVNADGSRAEVISEASDEAASSSAQFAAAATTMIDPLRQDERNILVAVQPWSEDAYTSVDKLDVVTRRRSPVAAAPVRRASFLADPAGNVRFAIGADADNASRLYHRDGAGAQWQLVNDENASGRDEVPLGFSADGRTAYLLVDQASGPGAIVAFDPATGARREVMRDAVVDPDAILTDPASGAVVGASFTHQRTQSRFFDEQSPIARTYRMLEKAFPGESVHVTSATADGKLLVVAVWSDRNPGDFYLFDTATRAAGGLLSRRIWLNPKAQPATRAFELAARDGLKLHGWLTEPTAPAAGPRPLVVMPHGGPIGIRDDWGFDSEAVMLAQAGYAVLRVNFRGSGGYGRAFEQAGAKQWGRAMQDDLVDATRWAIAQKIADPARICIAGASYGGYAALMGVARDPELYRCAVGYVGVYDLEKRHKDLAGDRASSRAFADEWMGARDGLATVSPTSLAARIKAPVLLVAGGRDEIAPIEHSRKMEKAIKAAGGQVQTLYVATESHGFYAEAHRRQYYVTLLDFLSRHLGGAKAKQ